jgi:aspartate kinase
VEIRQRVQAVVVEDGWSMVKVDRVPDRPGIAAKIFAAVASVDVSVDLILQNASVERIVDLSFTVPQSDVARVMNALGPVSTEIEAAGVEALEDLTKVELVGTGILSDPAYVGRMFRVLADAKVNILAIGTSEIRITCLIEHAARSRAEKALNEAFQVNSKP